MRSNAYARPGESAVMPIIQERDKGMAHSGCGHFRRPSVLPVGSNSGCSEAVADDRGLDFVRFGSSADYAASIFPGKVSADGLACAATDGTEQRTRGVAIETPAWALTRMFQAFGC
jgi:hypothetical protein